MISFGKGKYGQLGRIDNSSLASYGLPGVITDFGDHVMPKFSKIAAGGHHNVVISDDGNVFTFGRNDGFQCGIFELLDVCKSTNLKVFKVCHPKKMDIKCGLNHDILKDGDIYYLWDCNQYKQCLIPSLFATEIFLRQYQIVAMYPGYNETRIVTQNRC